jgi:outer membrane cobalamin receptor
MRYRSCCLFVFIVTSVLVAGTAFAGPINGRVVDPDNRPVPAARVLLVSGGSSLRTSATDARGEFSMLAPDTGRYELRVAVDGFRAEPVAYEATPASRDVGSIALTVSAVSESLVVSASQVEVPQSKAASVVSVITGSELRDRQVTTVADALRQVPGLTVARSGSIGALTSIFPRGGESDYTLVYLDGIQMNAFGGGFDFAHVSSTNIDRIEIARGSQSALYGSNAIGGVVRIVSKEDGPPTADASIEGGSFGTLRVTASTSGSLNNWSWNGGYDRLASDGFNGQHTSTGEEIQNDRYTRDDLTGGGGWRNAAGATVRGEFRYGRDHRGFPGPFGSNPIGVFSGVDLVSNGTNDRWGLSLGGTLPSGPKVRTSAQATWMRDDGDFVSPFGSSASGSRRATARLQTDVAARPGLDLSAGAEFEGERAVSNYIVDDQGEMPIERSIQGYFGEARWSAAGRLYATGGVRLEHIQRDAIAALNDPNGPRPAMPSDSVVSFNPKIAAAYYLSTVHGAETKVRGAAGTGIRPPDGFELAFTNNPSLKPERSRSVEAGIDQGFSSGHGLLEATWFHNSFDDLIVGVGSFAGSSRYLTDNISNARAQGLELGTTVRCRASGLDVRGRVGYTFLDSEILAVDRADAAPSPFKVGDPLLNRPRHQWSLDASVSRSSVAAWIRGGGRGRVLAVEPSYGSFGGLFDAAGYNVWSTGASWQVSRQLDVFGRIENLFDRDYEEVFGFPALGRGAMVGMRVAAGR